MITFGLWCLAIAIGDLVFGFLDRRAPFPRLLLSILAATGVRPEQSRLRGGRIIGPLERVLIFCFAVAGELTGAALIASAKSVLRFPELARPRPSDATQDDPRAPVVTSPDEATEYFLIGSLASWSLALAPLLIVE